MLLQMPLFHSFYGLVVFHCVYIPFFIQSSVNGHLGYFHVLATVNSAAMKIKVPYPFRLEFCLDICSGVELLNHMVVQFLVF